MLGIVNLFFVIESIVRQYKHMCVKPMSKSDHFKNIRNISAGIKCFVLDQTDTVYKLLIK